MPFHIDEKKARAWLRKALGQETRKRAPKPTLGLLGQRILLLTPEHRIEVEQLVSQLLAEQDAAVAAACDEVVG
mgnify:CR=1 FL=1